MANLTCPHPTNINPLQSNGFMLTIDKLPDLKYFCQSAAIPQLSFQAAPQANPFSQINLPGDKLEFGALNVNFMVDEHMGNYVAVYNWMKGLGFPKSNEQYSDFLDSQSQNLSESAKPFSDGTLSILGHNYSTVKSLRFVDLFPVSLSSVDFSSTNTDSNAVIGSASFLYTLYEFI